MYQPLNAQDAAASDSSADQTEASLSHTVDTDMSDLEQDMRRRLLPTPTSVAHAVALLMAEPRAELAYIPMYLPGKEYGWWQVGQKVVTVPGTVLIAVNSFEAAGDIPSGSWARDMASQIARLQMAAEGAEGATAWAVVRRDGHTSVFEDLL